VSLLTFLDSDSDSFSLIIIFSSSAIGFGITGSMLVAAEYSESDWSCCSSCSSYSLILVSISLLVIFACSDLE
jgi:hypothetical protein